jgi:hypothetical protein
MKEFSEEQIEEMNKGLAKILEKVNHLDSSIIQVNPNLGLIRSEVFKMQALINQESAHN